MSDAEAHAIFRALADGVRTYEQVVEVSFLVFFSLKIGV